MYLRARDLSDSWKRALIDQQMVFTSEYEYGRHLSVRTEPSYVRNPHQTLVSSLALDVVFAT